MPYFIKTRLTVPEMKYGEKRMDTVAVICVSSCKECIKTHTVLSALNMTEENSI
jgi:hypothetical protein